jgi:uncharacterized damage-inducible protein DinB
MTASKPLTPDYVRDTLALLGDQNPLTVLSETPAWIAARVEGLSSAALKQPEAEGKWSLTQVFAHIADAEIAFGWRARIVLTQDSPPMQGFDQGKWVTRFDYASADPVMALQAFTAQRQWNLRVWRSATPADMQRLGVHGERGPETFDKLERLVAGHDLRHRRQIDRILKVVR